MNGTESAYALVLRARQSQGQIHAYRFEGHTLRLANDTRYTPDFCVLLPDGIVEFHEVKGGFVRDDAKVKFKVAVEQYPEFTFRWCQLRHGHWTITEGKP